MVISPTCLTAGKPSCKIRKAVITRNIYNNIESYKQNIILYFVKLDDLKYCQTKVP